MRVEDPHTKAVPVDGLAPEAVVSLHGIDMSYGGRAVLDAVDLSASGGEMLALLGPSGSGKTTIVRIIGGFLVPDAGTVHIGGKDVTGVPPHQRGVGVVFQSYALFPHMSVSDNVAYGMRVRRQGKGEIARRTGELLDLVQLGGLGDRLPRQLSGGQQQRVALARALAISPELLLLDEPLSNLDANLRREVGEEIRRLQRAIGTTTVMVTHDRQEAFGMADRVAVLRDGRLHQEGRPDEVYQRPVSRFMAEFTGEANLLDGQVHTVGPTGTLVDCDGFTLTVRGAVDAAEGPTTVLVRPEDVVLLPHGVEADNVLAGEVEESFYYGSSTVVTLRAGTSRISARVQGRAGLSVGVGAHVRVGVAASDCHLLPASGS